MGLMSASGFLASSGVLAHEMLWQTKEPGTLERTFTAERSCVAQFEVIWIYGNVSRSHSLTLNNEKVTPDEELTVANGYAVWNLQLQRGDVVKCTVSSSNYGNSGQVARQFLNYIVTVE